MSAASHGRLKEEIISLAWVEKKQAIDTKG